MEITTLLSTIFSDIFLLIASGIAIIIIFSLLKKLTNLW